MKGGTMRKSAAGWGTGSALALLVGTAACTPTIKVEVAPINIYAKLDADVKVKLDKEVQNLIQQNPNLF